MLNCIFLKYFNDFWRFKTHFQNTMLSVHGYFTKLHKCLCLWMFHNKIWKLNFMSQVMEPEKWQDILWCCPWMWLQLKICPYSHYKFSLENVGFGSYVSLQAESWHRKRTPSNQSLGLSKNKDRSRSDHWTFHCGLCLKRKNSEEKWWALLLLLLT
jgi:hypothetical protein